MIEYLVDWCARNRFLVFTGTLFLTFWGIWAMRATPVDAVPDISDVQVIVSTEWSGRSPDLIEDQITYPLVSALISTPNVSSVRGFTDFGISYVYVIFEDGTDMYWARSRVVEYLQGIRGQLPEGVNPVIGPDATGVGWVFEYALVDETGRHTLADLRGFPDHHPGAVIDKELAADFSSRMDLHSGPETPQHADEPRDYRDAQIVQEMSDTVYHYGVVRSMAEQGLDPVLGRRVIGLDRLEIFD